jgi:hypothetical protein
MVMMHMWYKASFKAYSQLMTEKLKKIETANGSVTYKVADVLMKRIWVKNGKL